MTSRPGLQAAAADITWVVDSTINLKFLGRGVGEAAGNPLIGNKVDSTSQPDFQVTSPLQCTKLKLHGC